MSVGLMMDVHVHRAISEGLRKRGVDVLTAQDDGALELEDAALLDRATSLGRAVVTYHDDFLVEAHRRQDAGVPFAGLIFVSQNRVQIGACITDLEELSNSTPAEMANQVHYLSPRAPDRQRLTNRSLTLDIPRGVQYSILSVIPAGGGGRRWVWRRLSRRRCMG